MTQHTRSVLIGLMLGLATSASGQTLVEVATTTSIQNTLQSTGSSPLKVPTLPTPAATPADPSAAGAAPTAPAIPVTPLTAGQQAQLQGAQGAFRAGNYAKARREFELLVAANYTNPEPHFGLALALLAQKDDKGAAFELGQFVALAPDRYEGPYNLGVIATRAGNHDEALKLYTQAQTLMAGKAPPAAQRQVLEALAAEQTRKADFTALGATLAQITALDPKDLDAQYRLAQARTLAGQGAAALPGVYALLRSDPARLDGALLLADIYVAQGLPERALREVNAALARVKTGADRSELLLRKATILAAGGDSYGAVLSAQNATREDGRNAAAFARLGELRVLRNDRPGALGAYQNAVKLSPKSAAYRVGLAGVRLTLNQTDEAALDAALVLKLQPDGATQARAQFIQGVAAYRQQNYAQAVAALKASQARSPSADTALWLGLSAYARKDYGGAASALAESVKLNPAPTTRMNLASALLASARYAEAEAVLRGLVTDAPRNAEAWFMLGLAQRAQLREGDAKVSLKTAATLGSAKAKGAMK
ncbi:tetratricopeptide repeat protein [Deinococcus koreensis]|uniref:tetratricopeptide repeat protein n=1 Tax=Deinococcus koreensis TaxID=2054903 RepID=UPI001FAEAAD1|nr:tetratricopeptide repeat protein [Deinococcus koreensis]